MPLFIRSGSIIGTQNVDGVRRSRLLSNKFRLRVTLAKVAKTTKKITYFAKGSLLTIDSYDESNVSGVFVMLRWFKTARDKIVL